MGFLSNLLGAAVDLALTPVEVVKDIADTMDGKDANNTINRLKSAADNTENAVKDLI